MQRGSDVTTKSDKRKAGRREKKTQAKQLACGWIEVSCWS